MQDRPHAERLDGDDAEPSAFDRYADYEDGSALVICDRRNPNAWVRSDTTAALDP